MDDVLSREDEVVCVQGEKAGRGGTVFVPRQKIGDGLKKREQTGQTEGSKGHRADPPLSQAATDNHCTQSHPQSHSQCACCLALPTPSVVTYFSHPKDRSRRRNGTVAPKRARRANVGPQTPNRAAAALMKGLTECNRRLPKVTCCFPVTVCGTVT